MKSAGLINTLLQNYGTPVYITPGLLSDELAAAKPGLSLESYYRLNRFVQHIEGHIVINNGINFSSVLSFVVLKDDFLKDIVAERRENDRDQYMLTSGNNVIWSSEAAGSVKPGAIEAAVKGKHGIYKRQTISLTPFPLQLNIYKNNERQTAQQVGAIRKFLKLLGVGLVISTTLAYYFANRFLYPFRVLAKAARQAGKHIPLRKIPVGALRRQTLFLYFDSPKNFAASGRIGYRARHLFRRIHQPGHVCLYHGPEQGILP